MRNPIGSLLLVAAAAFQAVAAPSAQPDPLPGLAQATEGLQRHEGLLAVWKDPARGRLLLEFPPPGDDGRIGRYLHVEGLVTGLGSNPVGLDRGQLGPARLVELRRVGGRLLVEQVNLAYRALSDNPDERRAVRQSFASSVLWAGKVAAEGDDGGFLVDMTPFVVRDAHGVVATLTAAGQGSYTLDADRSVLESDGCLAFPDNLEFAARLTFAGTQPGDQVRSVTPQPESITLVQHQSLVRLPDDGYVPRRFDPRAGSFAVEFSDYAAPLHDRLDRSWIVRHRLRKRKPGVAPSLVVEPIVYYVDRGAPEPVRSALIDGASWWAEAFERAGFQDAFRVELLPEGAHPLDIRYNVIQWVHRSTRGWSYGGGVVDPRTGEMVKGHVSLGSLRVRQDRLLFEGLLGTDKTGGGADDDPVRLALARIRQLSAHEVGHTLGLAHNFAASTYADRASVMDYPAPWLRLRDGRLDTSKAYGVGVGAWDLHAVRYAYAELDGAADESAQLETIVREGLERGYLFMGDPDARPAGAAHPLANLWDNGSDPLDELEEVYAVRAWALERFGADRVAEGVPLSRTEETLVPLFLHHRFQLAAAAKSIGGIDYRYKVRGDGQPLPVPVAPARQRRALALLLDGAEPRFLDLPEAALAVLHPRTGADRMNRELFRAGARPAVDGISVAATAADLALGALLQPERCARLIEQHRRDPRLLSLEELLQTLEERLFAPGEGQFRQGRLDELRAAAQHVALSRAMGLVADARTVPAVRAQVNLWLRGLVDTLEGWSVEGTSRANRDWMLDTLRRFLDRPHQAAETGIAPAAPPGQPIGTIAVASPAATGDECAQPRLAPAER